MLPIQPSDIENIVRRVLERVVNERTSVKQPETEIHAARHGVADVSIYRCGSTLVTLDSIPKNLASIQTFEVNQRAVITPAVLDFLKSKKIRLVRTANSNSSNKRTDSTSTILVSATPDRLPRLIVSGTAPFMASIAKTVCPKQALTMQRAADDAAALREAAAGIRNGHQGAIVFAESPHATSWQASRDDRLRPVVVHAWKHLTDAIREVPTNIVILSNRDWNLPASVNAVRHFYRYIKLETN